MHQDKTSPFRQTSLDGCEACRLSVLMPVHNAIGYLDEAVASILGQNFGHFEFVIVDDGSDDGSFESLLGWSKRDPRIRLLRTPHVGITRALKYGLTQIDTPYVARMDADDIAVRERFECQLQFLLQHPEVVAVGSALYIIDEDGSPIQLRNWPETHEDIERDLLRGRGGLPHPAAMIRTDALQQIGDYCTRYRYAQDKDLWLRLSEVGKLANLPEPLLMYREHAGSIGVIRSREQFEALRQAVTAACIRRGLPLPDEKALPMPRPIQENDQRRRWARTAMRNGHYGTAWKHLRAAFKEEPLSMGSWRTLCAMFLCSWCRLLPLTCLVSIIVSHQDVSRPIGPSS